MCYYDWELDSHYFYSCSLISLPAPLGDDEAQMKKKDAISDYMYAVGAMLVLLMFLSGIFGGYMVYKKSYCCTVKQNIQKDRLLSETVFVESALNSSAL